MKTGHPIKTLWPVLLWPIAFVLPFIVLGMPGERETMSTLDNLWPALVEERNLLRRERDELKRKLEQSEREVHRTDGILYEKCRENEELKRQLERLTGESVVWEELVNLHQGNRNAAEQRIQRAVEFAKKLPRAEFGISEAALETLVFRLTGGIAILTAKDEQEKE